MQIALAPSSFFSRLFTRREAPARTGPRIKRLRAVGVRAGRTAWLPMVEGRNLVIHCRQGIAWITRDGELRDVVLRPDESFPVDALDGMTVHALRGDCALEIQADVD